MEYTDLLNEVKKLREENKRLKEILKKHNIPYEIKENSKLNSKEKLEIYKSYFKGREDAFAEKYIINDKKGYSLVCENKNSLICNISPGASKPCSNCKNKVNARINDNYIFEHMKGNKSYGIYPIIEKDKCYFLAIDFDDIEFKQAALAYKKECEKLDIDAVIELSQSGNGAHVWIFFENLISAKKARMIGDYILLNSMANNKNISFKSYDRFFPSQDFIDDKGYGNCIALPLQGDCVRNSTSIFVSDEFNYIPNQIDYLSKIKKITDVEISLMIEEISKGNEMLELNHKSIKKIGLMRSDFPSKFKIILDDDIYFSKNGLSTKALTSLKRLSVLYNPEFYEKQAKRLSTYNINRVIELFNENDEFISIPRGCIDDLIDILKSTNVSYDVIDKRPNASYINYKSNVCLYDYQQEAIDNLLMYNNGLLIAPAGSGKTIMGLEIINKIKKPTLIIVDKVKLIEQWKERIETFAEISLDGQKISPGILHGNKKKLSGIVDIASIKSINDDCELFDKYELVIGDEIHHVASQTYENIVRKFKARYFYGLTATPKRSDHLEKVVYKSIGDIRYEIKKINTPFEKILKPCFTKFKNKDEFKLMSYSDLCSELYKNNERNAQIVNDVINEYGNGRNIIILTERNDHVKILFELLKEKCNNIYVTKGTDKTKEKRKFAETIVSLDKQYIIISTTQYLGEGFDMPSLDTLFITMPF